MKGGWGRGFEVRGVLRWLGVEDVRVEMFMRAGRK